jgi:hypothetical protein
VGTLWPLGVGVSRSRSVLRIPQAVAWRPACCFLSRTILGSPRVPGSGFPRKGSTCSRFLSAAPSARLRLPLSERMKAAGLLGAP